MRTCHLTIRVAVATATLVAAGSGAIADPFTDCNSDDTTKRLIGCSELINSGNLSSSELAIAYSRRSDALIESGDLVPALSDRGKAFQLDGNNPNYGRRLSEIQVLLGDDLWKKGEQVRAINHYSDAVESDASNPTAFFARGVAYMRLRDLDAAITDISVAWEKQPTEPRYQIALSALYELRGSEALAKREWDRAIAAFSDASRLDPKNSALFVLQGTAYAQSENFSKAFEAYRQAIGLDQSNLAAHMAMAELLYGHKDYLDSLNFSGWVVLHNPKHVDALILRALTLEALERTDKAVADYQAVLNAEPAHKLALEGLQRLGVAIPPPVSGEKKRLPPDLANLDTKQRITLLQEELERVGCDPGEIDGIWGKATEEALDDFS